ncbi:MAG: hypothetical protein HY788_08410 [Deltaproteobacteria bacterium]|nr:hypothetical protein [Deltaproteobacteria bacterium]
MMKAAFPYWDNRIAPVFDVAREILLVEASSGRVVRETRETLTADLSVQKVLRLLELGVGTVICGAISGMLHEMVLAYGIRIIPCVTGDLRQVIRAWLSDDLDRDVFAMPGCFGSGRRGARGKHGSDKEGTFMQGTRRGGMGSGGGRGQGRGGRRGGRMGGHGAPLSTGGYCVCPQCGQKEPHQRGIPSFDRKCPKCGKEMMRE